MCHTLYNFVQLFNVLAMIMYISNNVGRLIDQMYQTIDQLIDRCAYADVLGTALSTDTFSIKGFGIYDVEAYLLWILQDVTLWEQLFQLVPRYSNIQSTVRQNEVYIV